MPNMYTWPKRNVVFFFVVSVLTVITLVLSRETFLPKYAQSGILTLVFDAPELKSRSLAVPVTSIASIAPIPATATSSIVSDTSSAIVSVQTDVSSLVPRNITFGTKEACVQYADHAECQPLPLRLSDALHSIPALVKLQMAISKLSPSQFEDCVIWGIAFTSLVVFLLVISALRHVLNPRQFGPKHDEWVRVTFFCSALSCVAFLFPVLAVCTFPSEANKVHLLARRGEIGNYYFGMLFSMVVSTVFLFLMGFVNCDKFAIEKEAVASVKSVAPTAQIQK